MNDFRLAGDDEDEEEELDDWANTDEEEFADYEDDEEDEQELLDLEDFDPEIEKKEDEALSDLDNTGVDSEGIVTPEDEPDPLEDESDPDEPAN